MSRPFSPVFFLLMIGLSGLHAQTEPASARIVAGAALPEALAAADLNHDGVSDLAVADSTGVVQVILNSPDGSARTTGIYNIGSPAAAIVSGDFDRDGQPDLIVAAASGKLYFLRGNGDGSFAAPVATARFSTALSAMAAADFDADGKLDLAVADPAGVLRILKGTGDGAFTLASSRFVEEGITALVAGNFLTPARADLAVATGKGVTLLPGNGDGAFAASVSILGNGPIAGLAAADLTGAGRASLVVSDASGELSILSAAPGGSTLNVLAQYPASPGALTIMDFNGDGHPDVLLAGSADNTVRLYPGKSDGTFGQPAIEKVGIPVTLLAAALAGSNAALASEKAGAVAVMTFPVSATSLAGVANPAARSAALMSLSPVIAHAEGASPGAQTTSSTTLTASPNPATFGKSVTLTASVLPGTATGKCTFYDGTSVLGFAPVSGGVAAFPTVMLKAGTRKLSARYDGDSNNLPSASAVFSLSVTDAAPAGYPNFQSYTAANQPGAVAIGDFNHDGFQDVAVVNAASSTVSVFLGSGAGTFSLNSSFATGSSPQSIVVSDFNSDGVPDLAVSSADGIGIFLGSGAGTFNIVGSYPANVGPAGIAVGDFNKDGLPDIVVANSENTNVSVLLGMGNGGFQPTLNLPTSNANQTGTNAVAVGDFNGDGNPDFAAIDSTSGLVYLFFGNGAGAFQAPVALSVGTNPADIAAADLNGDGIADLAIPDSLNSQLYILIGNGNGTFQAPVPYATGNLPSGVAIGDFNGDGKPDIAVVNGEDATVGIYINTGNGTFQPAVLYPPTNPGGFLVQVAIGEFNGDGAPDLAVADSGNFAGSEGELGILLSGGGSGSGPGNCTYTVSPTSLAFDVNGSTASVTLTASAPSCTWTASSSDTSWIVPGVSSGTGTTSVTVYIAPNTTGVERTGTFILAGYSIPVTEWATVQTFSDVPPSAYYFDGVNDLYAKGITEGCGVGLYCPTGLVTRAQMAVFIVRSVYNGSDDFSYNPVPYFTDVSPSTFGFAWIQKLYELGITSGCGPGLFCPNNEVTRDEMAVFIIRARFGASYAFDYPGAPYFSDVPANYWAFPWIQRLRFDNITTGCTATTYCPTGAVTRGDMAIFVMKGEFNTLLPAGTPVIVSITPAAINPGQTASITVTGSFTNFAAGATQVASIPGEFTVNSVSVSSPTTLVVNLTALPAAPAQPVSIFVTTATQEAIFPNALVVQ